MGQQGLPTELPTRIAPPTGAEIDQIKKFITDRAADLAGGSEGAVGAAEAARIKRARAEILEPLSDDRVSARFRIEYGKQLDPVLSRLAADPRDMVSVNALLIAGELATEQGVAILEKHLGAKNAVVRYTAAAGFGLSFEALKRTAPALAENRVSGMVDTLGQRAGAETDLLVLDTLARSLVAAMQVSEPPFQAIPARALETLSTKVGGRLAAPPDKLERDQLARLLDTGTTTGVAIRGMLTNVNANRLLSEDARREAAAFAGDLLSLIGRAIKSDRHLAPIQTDDDADTKDTKVRARAAAAQAAALAEAVFALVQTGYAPQSLGDLVKSAVNTDDARFLVGAAQIHEQLTRAPFNFPAQRFAPK